MKVNRRKTAIFSSTVLILAFAGPLLCSGEKDAALTDIQVSFKLDPRLMSGVYGGERWVSPPTYIGANAQDTVEAKAQGLDANGNPIPIRTDWIPSDPEMVTVTPGQGGQVKLTVKRAGESKLQVRSHGVSKELVIKAASRNNVMQVEIAQLEGKRPAEPTAAQDAPLLKSQKEKLSYALGMNVGTSLKKQSVEVDLDLLVQGIKDSLDGSKTLLADEQFRAVLTELADQIRSKLRREQAAALKALAEKNKTAGEAFLAENKGKDGVVTLPSGLQYKVLRAGDGKKPTPDDTVVCNYRGTLLDGTEIDSPYDRNEPATFALNKVIKGWNEALQLMPVGSKWQLFVPSNLAYGEHGARAKIGPNATLIFEVELVSIQDKPKDKS